MINDGTFVACRKCELCRQNIINDWAGRCIAESKTSKHAYFVTLTYGPDKNGEKDHIRATVLTYSDFQKYAKKLRKTVGKFKYFVVGEYGKRKGRAHWHAILFLQKPIPEIQYRKNINEEHWTHGFTYIEPFTVEHARYACKYVFKDQNEHLATSICRMSKKPPLGTEYFQQRAEKMVAAGIAPTDLFYSFRDIRKRNGEPIKFMLRRKSAQNFVNAWINAWERKHGKVRANYVNHLIQKFDDLSGKPPPTSDLLEDNMSKEQMELHDRALFRQGQRNLRDLEEVYGANSQNGRYFVTTNDPSEYRAYCLHTGALLARSSNYEAAERNAKRVTREQDKWERFHKPTKDDPKTTQWR
jgi:hypothetical protein